MILQNKIQSRFSQAVSSPAHGESLVPALATPSPVPPTPEQLGDERGGAPTPPMPEPAKALPAVEPPKALPAVEPPKTLPAVELPKALPAVEPRTLEPSKACPLVEPSKAPPQVDQRNNKAQVVPQEPNSRAAVATPCRQGQVGTPALDAELEVPLLGDQNAETPQPGALRISENAINLRLRRVLQPNPRTGEHRVSESIRKMYADKRGKGRNKILQVFQSCGFDADWLMSKLIQLDTPNGA